MDEPSIAPSNMRDHGALVHGSAPELMLDLWREAFRLFGTMLPKDAAVHLEKFIKNHPQLQNPQASQLSMRTAHAWKTYCLGNSPIPDARPGMFLQTLPKPVYYGWGKAISDDRIRFGQSLYADGGFKLTTNLEDYRVHYPPPTEMQLNHHRLFGTPLPNQEPEYAHLYWRGSNEFPLAIFQPPEITEEEARVLGIKEKYPHLQSVGEALCRYFSKPNWKTGDPRGSGVLPMRELVILAREYVGKETSPLASLGEGDAEEDFEEFGQQHLSGAIMHRPIFDGLDLAKLSQIAEIPFERLTAIIEGSAQATNEEFCAIQKSLVWTDNRIALASMKLKSKGTILSEKVHKAGISKSMKGYDELAEKLSVPVEIVKRIGVQVPRDFKIVRGCIKCCGHSIPLDVMEAALLHVSGAGRAKERRAALAAAKRASTKNAKQKAKARRQQEKIRDVGNAMDVAALTLSQLRIFQLSHDTTYLQLLHQDDGSSVVAMDYKKLGVEDPSTWIEVKTLHGDLRRVRLMDALKYEAEWEERRTQLRKYQADRREAKRFREESETMKAEGRCWVGKHRGTLWADMDFAALQWLAENTDGDLRAAAETEMMRQLGLSSDGDVMVSVEGYGEADAIAAVMTEQAIAELGASLAPVTGASERLSMKSNTLLSMSNASYKRLLRDRLSP